MIYEVRYSREDRLWTVGTEDAKGSWHPLRDCPSEEEACCFIHYLNGGDRYKFDDETIEEKLVTIELLLRDVLRHHNITPTPGKVPS